jgi:glycosyltransferase 2 family protein
MTVQAAEAAVPVHPPAATRDIRLFAPGERGRRNRRSIDAVFLVFAAAVCGLVGAAASQAPAQDARVARNVIAVLGWAEALWRTAFVGVLALAAIVLVGLVVRRRKFIGRDVATGLALEVGLAVLLARAVEADWTPFAGHLLSRWGFPEVRIASATTILIVAGPELVRPIRRVAMLLIVLSAFGAVALGAALPSAALGALALGLGAAGITRLIWGTAAGFPPAATIQAELAGLGVGTRDLRACAEQRMGCVEYVGHDAEGAPIKARVLGRDAQDTQRISRRWRALAYRDPPRSVAVGRLEQVEHEALTTLMAAQAGVRVPEVVTATLGSQGDALLVTREPDVGPLEDASPGEVTDALLDAVWKEVAALHGAGMSHGRLNGANIVVVDGKPMLTNLAVATLGAPASSLHIDVAELLVACTVLAGPERALKAALAGAGPDAVKGAIPYLERAALSPHTRDLAHDHEVELKKLREAAAEATGEKVPELVPIHRVRPRDFVMTGLIALAAYLLITKLAKIGFGTIYHELRSSDLAWVGIALVIANLTYLPLAAAFRGAVMTPLPIGPVIAMESADKFLNLTVPGAAGSIALNTRFLQRQGAETGEAIAASPIAGLAQTIVQILLVVCLLPFVRFHLDTSQLSGAVPSGTFVAVIFAVLAGAVAAVLLIPALRNRVVPQIKSAFRSLWAVARSGHKLAQLFGGALATEVLFALTLDAACRAYGIDLALSQLILVNVVASTLASLVPVPGGIGAAEAAIAGGLVAMGIPESTAFAVALTHRLCTYYTPPIWGYFSLRWLRRTGHV